MSKSFGKPEQLPEHLSAFLVNSACPVFGVESNELEVFCVTQWGCFGGCGGCGDWVSGAGNVGSLPR